MSIFWASINLLSLLKQQDTLRSVFGTIYDILMIVALIYFPTICSTWLHDKWDTLACEFLEQKSIPFLPACAKILRKDITGLASAHLVA
jgi:hypothetical protein